VGHYWYFFRYDDWAIDCRPIVGCDWTQTDFIYGIVIYFLGSLLCYSTQSFEWFLVGRFIQGIGVSGPYVASISIVRDKYSGAQMARIMSLIMMVFMVAPAVAPSLGQLIIHFFGWRDIFVLYMVYAIVVGYGWLCVWKKRSFLKIVYRCVYKHSKTVLRKLSVIKLQ
jgi:MFS family permease